MTDASDTSPARQDQLRFAIDSSHQVIAGPERKGTPEDVQTAIEDYVRLAQAADRAGVDSLWAIEDPDGWDAIAMLGVLARETDHIRLGPGVLNPWYRHPALIAASMSTLDALGDGRAFLGLGRGQVEWYERALGMSINSPQAALEESFHLLRQWLTPPWIAGADPDAAQFPVRHWERVMGPIQPRMPIYLAAVGPKALALAATSADGVIFNDLTSVTFMERAIREVREQAAAAGRDPDDLAFIARSGVTITEDPEAVYERRKGTIATIHTLPAMERLLESPGFDIEAIIADVREAMHTQEVLDRGGGFPELRRAGDIAEARRRIPADLMRELVVAGPAADVRQRLARFREIGVTDVFLARPPKGTPPESLVETVHLLADG